MSSAIGLSSPTRNQASIPLEQSAYSGVQDFSKFDAAELSGYVEAEGSSSFRASVKLSIVKNGAGTYEVAASDIAGDDVSGAPLVSFQMTGSLLEAKIDDGVASFSSAVIKFALISPPNSAGSLSIDASSVVSGTIDSARLPEAGSGGSGIVQVDNGAPILDSGTYTPTVTNVTRVSSVSLGKVIYLRVGDVVTIAGGGSVQCSNANLSSEFRISVPIAPNNNFGTGDIGGAGFYDKSATERDSLYLIEYTSGAQVRMLITSASTESRSFRFSATYHLNN
jgi:hypothetical protein